MVQRSALCRSRRELSNEYLLAKIGFDTAENEPLKVRITDHTFDHIPSVLYMLWQPKYSCLFEMTWAKRNSKVRSVNRYTHIHNNLRWYSAMIESIKYFDLTYTCRETRAKTLPSVGIQAVLSNVESKFYDSRWGGVIFLDYILKRSKLIFCQ